jgi:superfamily I DNA/RNA helicase
VVFIVGCEEGILPLHWGTEPPSPEESAEERRLLFVGITRARKDLIVTWNTGRQGEATPALGFRELQLWWQENARSHLAEGTEQ